MAQVNRENEEHLAKLMRDRKTRKPKAMLADEDFWGLIALIRAPGVGEGDDPVAEGIERLTAAVAGQTRTDIKRFEETLSYKLFLLDTKAHAEASVNSDDGFLYARCAVVAGGPECFESVLADPREMPAELELEALLSVAPSAVFV
jgi:hypothetical protein